MLATGVIYTVCAIVVVSVAIGLAWAEIAYYDGSWVEAILICACVVVLVICGLVMGYCGISIIAVALQAQ